MGWGRSVAAENPQLVLVQHGQVGGAIGLQRQRLIAQVHAAGQVQLGAIADQAQRVAGVFSAVAAAAAAIDAAAAVSAVSAEEKSALLAA